VGARRNVARTLSAKSVAGRQTGRDPVHAPAHATNFQPLAGNARNVSGRPAANYGEHFGAQRTDPRPAVATLTGTKSGPKTATAD
jgi:hypothetical protein